MAKTVQIRNLDDHTYSVLRTRAAAENLSLTAYLKRELEGMASRPSLGDLIRQADTWRTDGVDRALVAPAVRALRDERSE